MTPIRALPDTSLRATVVRRMPLVYGAGADPALDRPAHVRAGSGVTAWDGGLAVIQDDAAFVAWIDPGGGRVVPFALPPGHGGLRQFDDGRGNKRHKLDLEAVFTVDRAGVETLVGVGSGSTSARERLVTLARSEPGAAPVAKVWPAPGLYAALRARRDFSGTELNLEGAVRIGDGVRLFQRGNGAEVSGEAPIDATVDVPWSAFGRYLGGDAAHEPDLGSVVQYDLGELNGVRLTFTDAALGPGDSVVYLAAAEASPDTYRDGVVVGAAVGVIRGGSARYALLTDRGGVPLADKAEGIHLAPADPGRAHVVIDPDDPARPSELLEIELRGFG